MAAFYTISEWCLRQLFRVLYRHRVFFIGEKAPPNTLPKTLSGGAILAANHASFLDPPLVAASWPMPMHFLASERLFHKPLLGPVIRGLNAHPLGTANEVASLKRTARLLQQGYPVLVFPEGTRTQTGAVIPFKRGIGLLSARTGCPIVPTYIHGSFDAWPRDRGFPRLTGRTACVFGEPMYPSEGEEEGSDPYTALADRAHQAVLELQQWYAANG